MQEFESISASSYDPSALATKLTAKAAEGWSVVAIVPTGGDVTAFVTRDKDGAKDATDSIKVPDSAATPKVDEKEEKAEEESPSLVLPAKAGPDADTKPDAKPDDANEPSGWAIAPEPATPSTPSTPTIPTPERAGQPGVTIAPGTTPGPTATPSYEVTPAAVSPAAATPAAAPAVPAGWYADPAGRFELRYWDGSTWTEHVSRAGQQFTDPPVA